MVKSAHRTVLILQTVSKNIGGLTHSQISEALQIPSGSLTPLTNTLVTLGCLQFCRESKKFTIGSAVLSIAQGYMDSLEIVRVGQPLLADLVQSSGESAFITIRDGDDSIIVAKVNSPNPLRRSLEIGERKPLYASASGKAILAACPDQKIREYMDSVKMIPFTSKTTASAEQLWDEIRAVRKKGMSHTHEAIFQGVSAMAATVFDYTGTVAGALAISGPSSRIDGKSSNRIGKALIQVAKELSQRLGYRNPDENRHQFRHSEHK